MKTPASLYLIAAVVIIMGTVAALCLHSCGNNYVPKEIYTSGGSSPGTSSTITLASGLRSPSCLGVYSDYIYWSDFYEGKIYRVKKSGGSAETIASSNLSYPKYIYVLDPYIYIAEADPTQPDAQVNGIKRVGVNGTDAPVELFSKQYAVGGLVSDGTAVYWTQRILTNGTVRKGPLDGTVTATEIATSLNRPSAITYKNSFLYFTNEGTTTDGATGSGDGSVMKLSTGGGSSTTLASSLKLPVSITSDATNAYYCCEGAYSGITLEATIRKSIMNQTGSSIVLTGEGRITRVWCDSGNNYIYYIEKDSSGGENGSIKKTNIGGSDIQVIASSQTSPGDLITDSTYVFWIQADWSGSNGAIYRRPK
ncbi:MAG: DUF5050 domain-containing protein [Candidatus Eremiobacteraeota bacterium]|nr:DUF5050 domain-containing protein [Candidatus Eremiobacteraeota bacterium]